MNKATNGSTRARKTDQMQPNQWTHPALTQHEIRRVAVAAMSDPRCVAKYLWGTFSQPSPVRERVAAGLRECGYAHLIGTPEQRVEASANRARVAQATAAAAAAPAAPAIAKAVAR